jgi:hypothetical protein
MNRAIAISIFFLMVELGCGSSNGGKTAGTAGTSGTAGTTSTAGTTGAAGGAGTSAGAGSGAAGTSAAGASGAAGAAGGSGTAGAAGTTGAAGAAGTTGAAGAAGTGAAGAAGAGATGAGGATAMTFFVTSDKSVTGNLGGLAGADKRCQDLAAAAGDGARTWHAYLSVAMGPGGTPVNAKDRIGAGPWHNAKGALIANNVTELHGATRSGDHTLYITEMGGDVNGNWVGSPKPVEHDILTGSNIDGTLKPNETCKDWTSTANADKAWVGHADGLGPGADPTPPYNSWNSAHENGGCDNTAPKGGAGRLYCFAIN